MGCVPASFSDSACANPARTMAGDIVLLLHGSAGSGALWRRAAQALGPLYCCLTPDLIGYGKSAPWPKGVELTLGDESNALKPLLACCAETYHLVGYSYGGVVALQMALADPRRIRTLTLIEPVFFNALRYTGETDAFLQFAQLSATYEMALQSDNAESALRPFIDFWTGSGSWDRLPSATRAEMLKAADKIALDWRASFAFQPSRQQLAMLGSRTLLIRGTQSPGPMLQLVDALHALIPGSMRTVIDGASHLLPLTHGDTMTSTILSHLHAEAEGRLP